MFIKTIIYQIYLKVHLFFDKWREKKSLRAYLVIRKEPDSLEVPLCVTATLTQALEYRDAVILAMESKSFSSWCYWAKKDKTDSLAWQEYLQVLSKTGVLQQYQIKPVKYSINNLIGALRMFSHLPPLGCSFELPEEQECWDKFFKLAPDAEEEFLDGKQR